MIDQEFEITKVVDEIDESGHPVCIIHYRRGLSDNFIRIDGPSSTLDMVLIQKNIIEGTFPTAPKFAFDYHFQNFDVLRTVVECKDILFRDWVIGDDLMLEKEVLANFEQDEIDQCKEEFGEYWSIEIAARHVLRKFPTYSEQFYAALYLYEVSIGGNKYRAGYLAAEMKLKFAHEKNAILGEKNRISTRDAADAAAKAAKRKRIPKTQTLTKLYQKVCVDDKKCTRNFSLAAEHILKLAKQLESQVFDPVLGVRLEPLNRSINLEELNSIRIKSTGEFPGVESIRVRLKELEDDGLLMPPN